MSMPSIYPIPFRISNTISISSFEMHLCKCSNPKTIYIYNSIEKSQQNRLILHEKAFPLKLRCDCQQRNKKITLCFRATIPVVQKRRGNMHMGSKNEAELKEFAIYNLSAQETLGDAPTAQAASDLRNFLQTTVATFDEAILHFRAQQERKRSMEEVLNELYLDTMGAYREYLDSQFTSRRELEETIMAEAEVKQNAPQAEAKDAKNYVADLQKEVNARFQQLASEKKAFWQLKDAEIHRPYNPTFERNKNGYTSINAAILLQAQVERGGKDARWMSGGEIRLNAKISKKDPNVKPVKIFSYDKDKHLKGTLNMYNYADLNGVPEKDYYCKSDDWAKTFASNIHTNEKSEIVAVASAVSNDIRKESAKFNEAMKDNAKAERDAKAAEYRAAKEPFQGEEQKRLDALDKYDVKANEKDFDKKTPGEKMFHDMAKFHQEKPEAKNYPFLAGKEAMLRGEKESAIKNAIQKFAPQAAYNEPRKAFGYGSYENYVMDGLKKEKAENKSFAKALDDAKKQKKQANAR